MQLMVPQNISGKQGRGAGRLEDDFDEKPRDQQGLCQWFRFRIVAGPGYGCADGRSPELRERHQFTDPRDLCAAAGFPGRLANPFCVRPQVFIEDGIITARQRGPECRYSGVGGFVRQCPRFGYEVGDQVHGCIIDAQLYDSKRRP